MKSTPRCSAKRRSSSSLSDSAGTLTATPGSESPLLFDTGPPSTTRQNTSGPSTVDHGERELAVVDQQPVADADVVGEVLVRGGHPLGGARDVLDGDADLAPVGHSTGPSANVPSRIFGPCRSARMATARPVLSEASRTRW